MEKAVKWIIVRIVLDVLSLILVFLPFFILELGISPFQRGFFCDDNSIRYPYKDDTVSTLAITLSGLIVPIAIIIITEVVRFFYAKKVDVEPPPYRMSSTCSIPHYVICFYKIIGIFLFGCAISQSVTNIGKFTIGRLRPHFLDVCKPVPSKYNCTNANNFYVYVENVVCTGTDQHQLENSRLSFPSGHSSMAAYCAVFLLFYLQARFTWAGSRMLKHFAQVAFIYGAIYVCLSRVSDYKHHWSDVLGGAVIGTMVAALTSLHIFSMFKLSKKSDGKTQTDGASSGFILSGVVHTDN